MSRLIKRSFRWGLATLAIAVSVASAADEDAADLKALAGEWKRVRQVNSGEVETIEPDDPLRVRIRDNKLTLWRANEKLADLELTLKLVATTQPKLLDVSLPDGRLLEGIYKLDGKQWHLCLNSGADVRERPDAFTTQSGDMRVLVVLEKITTE